jgi:hypothetical protein
MAMAMKRARTKAARGILMVTKRARAMAARGMGTAMATARHHPLVLQKGTSLVCTSLKKYLLKLTQKILQIS